MSLEFPSLWVTRKKVEEFCTKWWKKEREKKSPVMFPMYTRPEPDESNSNSDDGIVVIQSCA